MTPRVALLDHAAAAPLAAALAAAGVEPTVVRAPGVGVAEELLRRRGFTGPLTHLPLLTRRLLRGDFDVVHAFSPPDAAAARLWRRRTGRPIVFTCAETLGRDTVADRRLRLTLLAAAVERSDAVVAGSAPARDALRRWLAVDAPVLAPGDAAGYARLYAELRRKP